MTEDAELLHRYAEEKSEVAFNSSERFEVGSEVPSADWKNAGTATARAGLEAGAVLSPFLTLRHVPAKDVKWW